MKAKEILAALALARPDAEVYFVIPSNRPGQEPITRYLVDMIGLNDEDRHVYLTTENPPDVIWPKIQL